MRFLYSLTCTIVLCLAFSGAQAQGAVPNNARITALFLQDQEDRKGFPNTTRSYEEINVRDEERRQDILAMLARAEVQTAQDFFYAAVIFHHGQTNDHYRLATSLVWIAATIEPKNEDYLWLSASTWDRMMLKRGKPQWYGAQERRNAEGKQEGFYPIDESAVRDDERVRFQVRPLAKLREEPDKPARIQASESVQKPDKTIEPTR